MMTTKNGGNAYEHSLNHFVEFFSKTGSLFTKRKQHYGNETSALALFQQCWIVEKETAMKLLFWLRDARGGAGNRSGFRECIKWLASREQDCSWVSKNLDLVIDTGRFDDLESLYGTLCEKDALEYWSNAIKSGNGLASKWADRNDHKLRKYMGMFAKDFRKMLVENTKVVEQLMCSKQWTEIKYPTVPSVAMARYTKAFNKNDSDRFGEYKKSLETGDAKINASVLFPHDCVRTANSGDSAIADAQFNALPNYMEGTDARIMCICDTSGSMGVKVSGSVEAVHVSTGLSLYCSEKIGKDNPFYRKFLAFQSESKFVSWDGMSFSGALKNKKVFDGAVGSTNIGKALDTILESAKFWKLNSDQLPNMLLIISDMQFDQGCNGDRSVTENHLKKWTDAGYTIPKIVYWNTAGNAGQPSTAESKNVALISGFSPSILKAVFSASDFSPIGVMTKAIEKYKVVVP